MLHKGQGALFLIHYFKKHFKPCLFHSKGFFISKDKIIFAGNVKINHLYRHHLMDRLASATLFSSLGAVMEAFKKARERIAHATKGYDLGKDEEEIIT